MKKINYFTELFFYLKVSYVLFFNFNFLLKLLCFGGVGVFIYRFMHATNFANNPLFNRYKVDSTMEYAYIFIFTCGFGLIFFQWN